MSVTGLSTRGIPNSLTGLETINASYNAKFVPYVGAATTVNLGAQNITTTHQATNSFDLVNLQVLTNAIDFVNTANALTYLNKVTSNTQTMNGEINGPAFTASGRLAVWNAGSQFYNMRAEPMGEDLLFQRDDSVTSIENILRYKLSANKWIFPEVTANKVPIFDADKGLVSSGVDSIKITYLDNVSSDIQTQLNGKVPLVGPAQLSNTFEFTSPVPITLSGLTASRVLQLDASKNVQVSSVTTTELGYVSGVTSSIQTQLNGKANTTDLANYLPLTGGTISGNLTVAGSTGISLTNTTSTTNGFLASRFYIGARGDNQDDVGSDNKWGPWYGLGESGISGFTGVPCLAGWAGVALRTSSGVFVMKDTGTVGIGITSPVARFQVNHSAADDYLTLSNTNYALDNYINLRFMFGPSTGTRSAYIQAMQPGSNQTTLKFFVDSGSGSVTERFRIQGNGSVLAFGPLGVQTATPEGDLHVQLAGAINDYWGKLKVKTTSFWGDNCSVRSETAGNQYSTIFPIMLLNPHVVSTDDGWCPIRIGRSGGVASGTWWEVAVRNDGHFQIGKERTGVRLLLEQDGSASVSGSFTVGSGGQYRAGCLYSDTNWGMIFRGVQAANIADFRWDRSNGTELMRIHNTGVFSFTGGGTGTGAQNGLTTRAGAMCIGNINTNYGGGWQTGLLMECADTTEITCHDSGNRLTSFIYYDGGNRMYLGRDTGWGATPITTGTHLSVGGLLEVGSASVTTLSTFGSADNRLMFRDTPSVNVGACSFWRYTNTSIAWTYGTTINYAFYVSSARATIVIHITGSGYGAYVGKTYFNVTIRDASVPSSYYSVDLSHFFNVTYSHTQMTQHITIPNNAWGGNTVGWKNVDVGWTYGAVFVDSDANDTLQFSVSVIG